MIIMLLMRYEKIITPWDMIIIVENRNENVKNNACFHVIPYIH